MKDTIKKALAPFPEKEVKQDSYKPTNKKQLTLFLIIFPSLLIAGNYGSFAVNLGIKVSLIFYQFILLNTFLQSYYKLID